MSNVTEGVEAIQEKYPSPYSPPSTPSPGRFVRYHQFEDGRDWPALILDVKQDVGVDEPPHVSPTLVCLLQVFRPRANHWKWTPEGPDWGYWSWPIPSPTPSLTPTTQPKVN